MVLYFKYRYDTTKETVQYECDGNVLTLCNTVKSIDNSKIDIIWCVNNLKHRQNQHSNVTAAVLEQTVQFSSAVSNTDEN